MKKSIIISLLALMISVVSYAQPKPNNLREFKAPSAEQIAKGRADHMQKEYNLAKSQYDKIYKLYLKQAKKDAARMEKAKHEQEQVKKELKKILNAEQWAKYEKMQKRPRFNGKQPMPQHGKPAAPGQRMKGPKIEQPQSRKNNMYIEQKGIQELK